MSTLGRMHASGTWSALQGLRGNSSGGAAEGSPPAAPLSPTLSQESWELQSEAEPGSAHPLRVPHLLIPISPTGALITDTCIQLLL